VDWCLATTYWYYRWHQDQISDSDPTSVEGQNGFWFRRLYFTYDYNYSEKFTTRLRLEMNSNGKFAGGDLVPYVKDAYVKWTYTGKQQRDARHPTELDVRLVRCLLGATAHREERRPISIGLIHPATFGVTVNGPMSNIDGLSYAAQFGDESGSGSEIDQGKIARVREPL
jgi:hypothetical protein